MPDSDKYYVPHASKWPIITAIGLGFLAVGAATCFHGDAYGPYVLLIGTCFIIYIMVGWFGAVIAESQSGLYSHQMDRTFRWSMFWFIFSEVMFFAGFFGALFYVRNFAIPWLGGEGAAIKHGTHQYLWPNFMPEWPLLNNPNPDIFPNPLKSMPPLWLPLFNTVVLLLSSVTLTISHHALIIKKRKMLEYTLIATIILGVGFLCLQAYEYHEAYTVFKMRLDSGIYGTTFFMLTGFHGAHVTIGLIILGVILARCVKGHFTPENHFGFQASAWYWHFVDVVWLILFIYVYVLPLRSLE